MNKVILIGRLTREPEVRYSQGENASAVARYTLAVGLREREMQRRILSVVYALVSWQNLQRSIYIRA